MSKDTAPNFSSAIEFLQSGKIVIYPTETLYGMGVDAQNAQAIEFLFKIKKRDLSKPISVLLPNKKDLKKYAEVPDSVHRLVQAFWPGPLTIVLKSNKFPKGIVSKDGKVGFRVSSHPLAQNLLLKYNRPITTTSANVANQDPPDDTMEFFKIFPKHSFVLIQEIKPSKRTQASTVVDCSEDTPKILREGEITLEDLQEVLSEA